MKRLKKVKPQVLDKVPSIKCQNKCIIIESHFVITFGLHMDNKVKSKL